jgi:hypothetical protein
MNIIVSNEEACVEWLELLRINRTVSKDPVSFKIHSGFEWDKRFPNSPIGR